MHLVGLLQPPVQEHCSNDPLHAVAEDMGCAPPTKHSLQIPQHKVFQPQTVGQLDQMVVLHQELSLFRQLAHGVVGMVEEQVLAEGKGEFIKQEKDSELPLIWTPKMRPPLYSGHSDWYQGWPKSTAVHEGKTLHFKHIFTEIIITPLVPAKYHCIYQQVKSTGF